MTGLTREAAIAELGVAAHIAWRNAAIKLKPVDERWEAVAQAVLDKARLQLLESTVDDVATITAETVIEATRDLTDRITDLENALTAYAPHHDLLKDDDGSKS